MKVKYIGETDPTTFIKGKIYEVISIEQKWYRIVDETNEDYLYPPDKFEIVEDQYFLRQVLFLYVENILLSLITLGKEKHLLRGVFLCHKTLI